MIATHTKVPQVKPVATVPARRCVAAAAQKSHRRAALAGLAAAPALLSVRPSKADYGEGANVFGRITNRSGFVPYTGDGFALLIPSKYIPSKEKDFKGVKLRYEDNQETLTNFVVLKMPSSKGNIEGYGSQQDFLTEVMKLGLLGKQAYTGSSRSEGGFAEGRYAAASLLDQYEKKDSKGRNYYQYEVLVRSADGNEGGRHHIIKATVGSDGNLYLIKFQAGDKRWFKGTNKDAFGTVDSFIVA